MDLKDSVGMVPEGKAIDVTKGLKPPEKTEPDLIWHFAFVIATVPVTFQCLQYPKKCIIRLSVVQGGIIDACRDEVEIQLETLRILGYIRDPECSKGCLVYEVVGNARDYEPTDFFDLLRERPKIGDEDEEDPQPFVLEFYDFGVPKADLSDLLYSWGDLTRWAERRAPGCLKFSEQRARQDGFLPDQPLRSKTPQDKKKPYKKQKGHKTREEMDCERKEAEAQLARLEVKKLVKPSITFRSDLFASMKKLEYKLLSAPIQDGRKQLDQSQETEGPKFPQKTALSVFVLGLIFVGATDGDLAVAAFFGIMLAIVIGYWMFRIPWIAACISACIPSRLKM